MSIILLGQSYAQDKQKARSGKTVVMEQISPAAYTTFKVSNNVTMYKVRFQNQYKMNVAGHLFIPKSIYSASEPKELLYLPNAGHVDLYDKVELIPFNKLETFFKKHLKENSGNKTVLADRTGSTIGNALNK